MDCSDVAALAEADADAARLGLDPGGADVLERYQRWRRFDTMMMGVATDGLNRLFSNHSDVLRLARDVGLGLVERMPMLKRMFIREASGLTGDVPKLLKGEVLYALASGFSEQSSYDASMNASAIELSEAGVAFGEYG
jgi:2-octaprenyl-6-methoxyphenol hydroxylase